MSTLATHHDGLDREMRGWDVLTGKGRGRTPASIPAGTKPELAASAAATGATVEVPAMEASQPVRPSMLARWRAAWAQRRENARLEALMREDPRVRADLRLAAARAEWQD